MTIDLSDIPKDILDQAGDWWLEMEAVCGDPPPTTRRWQFQAWLKADPRHRAAYQDLEGGHKDFIEICREVARSRLRKPKLKVILGGNFG